MTLSKLIENEIADFFTGFGAPCEPDIQSGEAQRQLTERLLSVLALRERAEPVAWMKRSIREAENWDSVDPEFVKSPEGWMSDYLLLYTAQPAPVVPDDVLEDAKILGAGFLKVLADGETHRLDPQKVIVTFKNESGQPVASWWLNGDFSAEISRQTDAPPAPGKGG